MARVNSRMTWFREPEEGNNAYILGNYHSTEFSNLLRRLLLLQTGNQLEIDPN